MDVDPNCIEFCNKLNLKHKNSVQNYALIEVPIASCIWSNINYNLCLDFRNNIKAKSWRDSIAWTLPQCKLRFSLNFMNETSSSLPWFIPTGSYSIHIKLEFTDKNMKFVLHPIELYTSKCQPGICNWGQVSFIPLVEPRENTAILKRKDLLQHFHTMVDVNQNIWCKGYIYIQPLQLSHQFRLSFGPLFEINDTVLQCLCAHFGTIDGLLHFFEGLSSQFVGKSGLDVRCRIGLAMSCNIWQWWWQNYGLYRYPLKPKIKLN